MPPGHGSPFTRSVVRSNPVSTLLILVLSVFALLTSLCSAIDPRERIGTCKQIHLNVTYYVNANEGVWFPQYRSEDSSLQKKNTYSCHTTYEKVYLDDTPPARLESDTYYTLNGKAIKTPYTSTYYRTEERGKLGSSIKIPNFGSYEIYNYFLEVTPEFRVRYVCTDFPSTIPGVAAIYIETRKAFPSIRTIMEAQRVLQKHNFKKKMVKINQKHCTRPINMDGYISLISEEKSTEK